MTIRLLGIGTAIGALALTAGLTAAQADRNEATPATPDAQAVGPQAGSGGPQMGMRQGRGPRGGQPGVGPMQQRGRGRAFGPNRGPGQGRGPMARGGGLGPALNLTDEQRSKIEALHKGARDRSDAIADELEFTRQSLHRETFADKRDNGKVNDLAAKVTALEKQLFDLRLKTQTAVADLLTAEQRATMRVQERRSAGPGRGQFGDAGGMGRRGPGRGPGR